MRQCKKAESLVSVAKRFNVSKRRLYEITAGHKIGRPGKGDPKQLEPDTPADAQTATQMVKCQVDDLVRKSRCKETKGWNKLYQEGW